MTIVLAAAFMTMITSADHDHTPAPFESPRVENKSFCTTYIPSIRTNADFDALEKLADPLRSRIRDNEVNYLCNCMHWENDVCNSTTPLTSDKSSP
jgi:hypothetical protein